MLLDKLREVAAVVDKPLVLVMDDVGTDRVEEAAVVRDEEDSDLVLRLEVILQPCMPSRSVHLSLGNFGRVAHS